MKAHEDAHTALKVLLTLFAVLVTAGALLLMFFTGWLLHWIAPDTAGQSGVMLVVFAKFIGALGLFVAYLLFVTARDPVRYIGFVDAFAGLMFLAALMDVYALIALNFGAYYPPWAIWARVALRVALGIVLIVLRPRGDIRTS